MTTSVTIFILALVGITVLLVSKYVEQRTGRPVFLPQWLGRYDETLRQAMHYFLKKMMWRVGHHTRTSFSAGKTKSIKLMSRVRSQDIFRFRGTLKKNGSASVYLKQIAEHKAILRNKGE